MSTSGSLPSDLKNISSTGLLRPDDGTAQLDKIKQEIAEGEHSMDCADGIGIDCTFQLFQFSVLADSVLVAFFCMYHSPVFGDTQ